MLNVQTRVFGRAKLLLSHAGAIPLSLPGSAGASPSHVLQGPLGSRRTETSATLSPPAAAGYNAGMVVYKAAYSFEEGTCIGEVLDFPGTVSCGETLDEARANLAAALLDMAETNLELGEPLPRPDPNRTKPNSDVEEPIYLVLQASHKVSVTVQPETAA